MVSRLESRMEGLEEEVREIHRTMQAIESGISNFAEKTREIDQTLSGAVQQLSSSQNLIQNEVEAEQERHGAYMQRLELISEAQGNLRHTLDNGFAQTQTHLHTLSEREITLRDQVTKSFERVGEIMEEFRVNMNNKISDLLEQIGYLEAENTDGFEKNARVLQDILSNRETLIEQFAGFDTTLQEISSSMEVAADSEESARTEEHLRESARLNDLGLHLIAIGQVESAVAILRKAAELAPDHSESLLNLGQAYLSLKEFDHAEETFRKITEGFPESGQAFLGMAVTCIHQSRYSEALEHLSMAEIYLPDSAETKAYKGLVLFSQGATQDARACWNRAIELDPRLADRFETAGLSL